MRKLVLLVVLACFVAALPAWAQMAPKREVVREKRGVVQTGTTRHVSMHRKVWRTHRKGRRMHRRGMRMHRKVIVKTERGTE